MTVKTGSSWSGSFVCLDATGALATPSVGPAGVLYLDGVANAASVTISGSNPYKWTLTLPALTAGQRVDMYITATIATIATAAFVASDQADTLLLSDGVTVADYATGKTPLQPTVAGRTLDVSAGGEAGLDWANVGSPTTTVGLSGTTVKTATDVATDTTEILTRVPDATPGQANGLPILGDNAAGLTVAGSIAVTATGNDSALALTGSGTGSGIKATSGGSAGGAGIWGQATGSATVGILAQVASAETGVGIYGNAPAVGICGRGNASGGDGIYGLGTGDGAGMKLVPGVTGTALETSKTSGRHVAAGLVTEVQSGLSTFAPGTDVVEGTITFTQALQVLLALLAGKASGGATTEITFRNTPDTADRVVMTVDSNGNRSSVTLTF